MNYWVAFRHLSTLVRPPLKSSAQNMSLLPTPQLISKWGAWFTARSILEWTKEPGIVIISCVYEDAQIICDHIDNASTIEKYIWWWLSSTRCEMLCDWRVIHSEDHWSQGHHHFRTDTSGCWWENWRYCTFAAQSHRSSIGYSHQKWQAPTRHKCLHVGAHDCIVGTIPRTIMPSAVKGHSDCISAIIRLNDAMLAFNNTQSSVTAGVLISGEYQFRRQRRTPET
jgi:hypothetical protein